MNTIYDCDCALSLQFSLLTATALLRAQKGVGHVAAKLGGVGDLKLDHVSLLHDRGDLSLPVGHSYQAELLCDC